MLKVVGDEAVEDRVHGRSLLQEEAAQKIDALLSRGGSTRRHDPD